MMKHNKALFLSILLVLVVALFNFNLCFAEKGVSESEIIAVINKWYSGLYQSPQFELLGPVYIASLMDPAPYQIATELKLEKFSPEKKVTKLKSWIASNMVHTQTLSEYKNLPGKDPWGATFGIPTYKNSIPSEMKAMEALTGKFTGKCTSLAFFNAALFTIAGVEPENVVLLRIPSHTIALIKFDNKLYFLSNLEVLPVTEQVKKEYGLKQYQGVFNSFFSIKTGFQLTEEDFFNPNNSPVRSFESVKKFDIANFKYDATLPSYTNREELLATVFGSSEYSQSKIGTLAKYAYLSLKVKKPEMYLKAALNVPLVTELAKQLNSVDDIFKWINRNVKPGSIFEGEPDRIMPAEDVVLFKKGSPMDKALLAWALLKLNGHDSTMIIGAKSSYIELDKKIYDVNNFKIIDSVTDDVRYRLTL